MKKTLGEIIETEHPQTVVELYEKDLERWAQGSRHRVGKTEDGEFSGNPSECVCFCLTAAITYVYKNRGDERHSANVNTESVIGSKYPDFDSPQVNKVGLIPAWNDHPGRTVEEVLDVARRAGI